MVYALPGFFCVRRIQVRHLLTTEKSFHHSYTPDWSYGVPISDVVLNAIWCMGLYACAPGIRDWSNPGNIYNIIPYNLTITTCITSYTTSSTANASDVSPDCQSFQMLMHLLCTDLIPYLIHTIYVAPHCFLRNIFNVMSVSSSPLKLF